jgi:hypothetical protein
METAERMNTIAVDSTTAILDGAYVFQKQALQLGEAWLKAFAESQKLAYDLTKTLVKHSYEAQGVWRSYASDSVKDLNGQFAGPFTTKAAQKAAAN